MNSLIQESFLDGSKQVIRKDTQKDVRLGTLLQVMENRTLHEGTLHGAECCLDACEKHVGAPNLISRQILPIRFQNVAAIQLLGDRFLLRVFLPGKILGLCLVVDLIITRDPWIALLQPTNGLMNLFGLFQMSLLDTRLQSLQILDHSLLLFLSDGSILFLPSLTQTENVNLIPFLPALDLYPRLLLQRITGRRHPNHFFPVRLFLKIIQPLISLRLPSRYQVIVSL